MADPARIARIEELIEFLRRSDPLLATGGYAREGRNGQVYYTWNDPDPQLPRFSLPSPAERYRQLTAGDYKGRKLLRSLLTTEQKDQLDAEGSFMVTGSSKGLYRIDCTSTTFNVTRFHRRTKQKMYRLCAGPTYVTCNDFWLAQKLMIEADEKRFGRIANRG